MVSRILELSRKSPIQTVVLDRYSAEQDRAQMSIRNYRDFVIYTDSINDSKPDTKGRPGKFSLRIFDSPVGEGEHDEEVAVGDWDQLEKWRKNLADRQITRKDFERLTQRLGEIILPPYARQLYQSSLARLQEGDGLRIRLRLLQELAFLPWEYALVKLHDGEIVPEDHWALDFRISIVRHEAISVPAASFRASPNRRVIIAMASPEPYEKYPRLDLENEQTAIKGKLREINGVKAEYHPDFDLENDELGVTQDTIQKALRDSADIFHFSGHGIFRDGGNQGQGHGALILADENNKAEEVQAEILSGLLAEGHIRLVVLDACESGERDRFLQWSSVAMALLRGGIPAVVAMQYSIYDDLTKLFATKLYEYLVAGLTIDEAVTQARKAIHREDPRQRDWGAPVLYLRNSGGNIFPPVTDEQARLEAEKISERDTALSEVLMRWVQMKAPANPLQLQTLKLGGDSLSLGPLDAVLLLHSAIETDQETAHWVRQLRRVGLKWLESIQKMSFLEPDGEIGLAEKSLGLDFLSDNPSPKNEISPLAWIAAGHSNSATSQTAALALLAVQPDIVFSKIQEALLELKNNAFRRQRRAMLLGALAEADAEFAKHLPQKLDQYPDRAGVWWWRARKHIHRNHTQINRWIFGGAIGAGLALAIYRAFLAIFNAQPMGTEFAINSYWGFIIGLGLVYGMVLAVPLRLLDFQEHSAASIHPSRGLSILLGALGFCLANGFVAWLNGIGLSAGTFLRFLAAAFLAGLGLNLGLMDQPQAGWRLGKLNWGRRLILTSVLLALIQAPVLVEAMTGPDGTYILDNAQWLASSVIEPGEAISNKYSLYPALQAAFDQNIPIETGKACFDGSALAGLFVNCFEQWWSILDAALVGVVLVVGITVGLHFPQTGLGAAWRKLMTRLGLAG